MKVDRSFRPKYFYGYINSVFAGIALFLVGGANYVLPAMSGFMRNDLGWSATATGGAFSVYYVVFGAFVMGAGALVVRFGPRLLIGAGAFVIVIACVLLSVTHQLWQFYLLAGLYAAGMSSGGVVTGPQLASNWLHKRRGLVIGLLFAVAGLGGSVLVIVGERVMGAYGSWRPSWVVMAGIMLIPVILAALLIRNRPEDLGQNVDAVEDLARLVATPEKRSDRAYKCLEGWTVREAARTPSLWLLVLTFGFSDYVMLGMLSHQVTYLTKEVGISAGVAAGALALMVAFMAVGKAGGGWLADRIEPRKTLGLMSLMLAAGLLVLLFWHTRFALYLYVILLGVGFGGSMTQTTATVANYYGRKNVAAIMGLVHGSAALLGALSTTMTGVIRDSAGTYVPAFIVMLVLAVVGATCAFLARIPQRKVETADEPGAATLMERA
jgi:MFS family permease